VSVTALRDQPSVTVRSAVDRFLSSARCANPSTRRAYASALDRLAADLGPDRLLATVAGEELAAALQRLWGDSKPATWNRNRAAVASWLAWCARNGDVAPALPPAAERRADHADETKALPRPAIERLLTRRDVPLREKTLWRMLYETAARAGEVLGLNVEDLDLEARRAPVRSKGGQVEWVYWAAAPPTCSQGCCGCPTAPRAPAGRCSSPSAVPARRGGRPPGPCARTPAGPGWATTAPGSSWTPTPVLATGGPGGISTSCATRPPRILARATWRCS
jgi:hypothetical protein